MQKRIAIKDYLHEIHLITRRSIGMLILVGVCVTLLVLRLGFLQLVKQDLYTTLSKKNWLDLVPLEPTRGLIYDRNGVLLAENIPVFSLDIIPYKINNLPKTLAEISRITPLKDNEIIQLQKQLKQHRLFEEITLKFRLTEEEVAKFYENQYQLPGVIVRARLLRHYPLGNSFSQVLGYVGRINADELDEIDEANYSASNYIGKQGIEKFYEEELHGTVGYQQAENDASGEPVRILKEITPAPGKNLYLTIDSQLQIAAENALKGHRGAVVAIQPKTGQVLALVSAPSFDPNVFATGISSTDYQALQNSPDRPLYNRALRGLYPLASTIKPYIALEGLDSGIVSPDFTIEDPGWFQLPNSEHLFHDWRHHGHGIVNLNRAITVSCDTYFYQLAVNLGIDRIDTMLKQFGFGDLTGIDLSEEVPGILASPTWKRKMKKTAWYKGDTVISGIGQGFMQATPLQLASGVATLAMHGQRYTPYLVLSQEEPGKIAIPQPPTPLPPIKLHNATYWSTVINAMQNVVESNEGTGFRLGHTSYSVAAKTGTAQVFSQVRNEANDRNDSQLNLPERLRDHHLLIAFAPVQDPQIAIAVIVENSNYAVTAAKQILDFYFLKKPIAEEETDEENGTD